MGVHGLWRLLDASGKPVPLETLEGKVLAIDVSIWIHQVLQGYQDRKGSAVPNAHLLGLFHRICKLLYFKIRPVFVFDGGVPMLKKNTIASRKKQKAVAASKAQQMKHDLIQNLIKHTAVKGVLAPGSSEKSTASSQGTSNSKASSAASDMFKLPNMPIENESPSSETLDDYEDYDSDTSIELSPRKQSRWKGNIHNVDVTSDDFKALPADVRYDVLTDLKETRKQSSWGRLHEMPQVSHEFSNFQMERLLKRRRVQESLENAEKEMGGKTLTLEELEQLLTEQGIDTSGRDKAYRIAGDSTTRLIFINDPKALRESSKSETIDGEISSRASQSAESRISRRSDEENATNEMEPLIADLNEYDLDDEWDSDNDSTISEISFKPSPLLSKKFFGKQRLNPALAYMLEHAGLPQEQIFALIEDSRRKSSSSPKTVRDNKTAIERKEIFGTPKIKSVESEESKIEGSSAKPEEDALKNDSEGESKLAFELDEDSLEKASKDHEDPEIAASSSKMAPNFDNSNSETPEVRHGESIESSNALTKNDPTSKDEALETPVAVISDSDTDSDLVEIHDVPIPEKGDGLEILVKSNEMLKDEDDLFADVFAKEPQDVSDTSTRDNSAINDSAASTSFQDIQETSIRENEIVAPVEGSKEPHSSSEIVESQTEKSVIDIPIVESRDFQPVASSSRDRELDERIATFKPELLQANRDKLVSMEAELESEHNDLTENIGKLERQATAVTDQMRTEAQDLLRLFGIPYVVAPMEAEAQCAYLENIELTDGTITDDSDIWLFGGRCVYKNFFNNNKRVMQYKSTDIEHHFKLTRQQMIQLALLVGSDYTVGVSGIGPVTALEILAAFPTEGDDLLRGLGNFCSWLRAGRSVGPGRTALRNKLRNVQIDRGFPSQAVVQAYLFPTVDESREPFTWSKPNLTLLADYTRQKFGWTRLKFEETIGPVVKKLAEAKSQKGITSYFSVNTVPKSIETTMSKRVQKAVRRLGNFEGEEDSVEQPEVSEKFKEKTGRKGKRTRKNDDVVDANNSGEKSIEGQKVDNGEAGELFEATSLASKATKIPKIPNGTNVDEFIPQREKDKAIAHKKKLRAIEVFKKSKKNQARTKKPRRTSIVRKEVQLSESSDSS